MVRHRPLFSLTSRHVRPSLGASGATSVTGGGPSALFGRGDGVRLAGRPHDGDDHAQHDRRARQSRDRKNPPAPARPDRGLSSRRTVGRRRRQFRGSDRRRLAEMSEVAFQQCGHLRGALEAFGRVLRHEADEGRFQPGGPVRPERADRRRRLVADPAQHGHGRRAAERRPSGTHGVEHTAEAEQVRPVVDRFAARLLGGHVLRRAGDDAVLRQLHVVGHPRQAEVGDLDAGQAVLQQQVGRLDVAVDQTLGMRGRQSRRGLQADADDLHRLQRPGAVEPGLE